MNNFFDTVPTSIKHDKNVQAFSEIMNQVMIKSNDLIKMLLLLPNLEYLPETLLDELAWQWHVDAYLDTYSRDKKINLIRNSISDHKIRGTPAAVEKVIGAVFRSGKVVEWFEYDGEPYHFRIKLITEPVPDITVIENLNDAVQVTKNTRSWLDDVSFYREVYGSLVLGLVVAQHKTVEIYPAKFKAYDISGKQFIGLGKYYHRKVEIK